jgi:hypothetical protein
VSPPTAAGFFAEEAKQLPIAAETFFSGKSVTFQGMGRSPTATNNDTTGSVGPLQSVVVEGETEDIKMEHVPLSVSTKLDANSTKASQKMKPRRALYSHLLSVKKEALSSFTEIRENTYQFEELGESQQGGEVMTCECVPLKSGTYAHYT